MPIYKPYPSLQFNDAYAQPSETTLGRRLVVVFDSDNVYMNEFGQFSEPDEITPHPVIIRVFGSTTESNDHEDFEIEYPGQSVSGNEHFITFEGVEVIDGYKVYMPDSYGVVEVRELMPINYLDDGYSEPETFVQFTAYGSGWFLFDTSIKNDGYNIDPGYGQYEFSYASPFQITIKEPPETLFIGNSANLQHSADGVLDEIKITSATATKSRTRQLAGSYDISVEATSPIFSVPDAKTLVLLHLNDNSQALIDAIREPLDSANLSDSILAAIISLRNDRQLFLNYVNSLHITGTIVEESLDTRPISEQLFDLVEFLNNAVNSAAYYKIAGNYLPSEIVVNSNFEYAAVFSGDTYTIEQPGLINNNQGSIELWIAPLANLLGDFKRRVYLDAINHAVIGADGSFISTAANVIKLPNNIRAKHINSIKLAGSAGQTNTFNFNDFSFLSGDGSTITLMQPLPANNTPVVVDYIPLSSTNDRLTLFKDEDSNLVFGISASGTLYQTSRDISHWKRNEWHRVMITWKANDKNNLDHLHMYVDGTESSIIKYGEGFLFGTFVFKQEHQADINTKVIPQNIQFVGTLDSLYVGTDFEGQQQAFCRMANLRVSYIERPPVIDARGFKTDFDFDGGSKSAVPSVRDSFTSYLEDFDPNAGYITKFASAQDPRSGAHDLKIVVRDNFHLVRGVGDGRVERLLRELIKVIKPAEARTRIVITTNE